MMNRISSVVRYRQQARVQLIVWVGGGRGEILWWPFAYKSPQSKQTAGELSHNIIVN